VCRVRWSPHDKLESINNQNKKKKNLKRGAKSSVFNFSQSSRHGFNVFLIASPVVMDYNMSETTNSRF